MRAGMSVARLNSAHGDLSYHQAMLSNVRRAECELGQLCAIMVDVKVQPLYYVSAIDLI